jgi:hypothetical protein
MAPVNTALAFVELAMVAVAFRTPPSGRARLMVRTAALLSALAAAWGGVLLVLPGGAGELLLGETWPAVRVVLPWTITQYVLHMVGVAVVLGLQAEKQARIIAVGWVLSVLVTVIAVVVAAVVGTSVVAFARAMAFGALGEAVIATVLYVQYVRRVSRRNREVPADGAPAR